MSSFCAFQKGLCAPKSSALQSNLRRASELARLCTPSQAESRAWLRAARKALNDHGLQSLGLAIPVVEAYLAGRKMVPSVQRLAWHAWSLTHCPTNLSTLHHWITWGRFNPAMPQDYRGQAIKLLNRKTGPTRKVRPRIKADGTPERIPPHWSVSARLKKGYQLPTLAILPPC